jgi:hypothetical protein
VSTFLHWTAQTLEKFRKSSVHSFDKPVSFCKALTPIIRSKAGYGSAAGNCSAYFIMASLEHFRNTCRLFNVLEGGFSLRKKLLSSIASIYTNSYNALDLSRMTFSATGSFPEARGSGEARSGADSLLGTLPLKVVSAKVQGK